MEYVIVIAILLVISVLILIISMFITSSLGGGVEFGEVHIVLAKAVPLLLIVVLLEAFVPYGNFISIPIWWIGLMLLFRLDFWEVRTLVAVNWILNGLASYAVLATLLSMKK